MTALPLAVFVMWLTSSATAPPKPLTSDIEDEFFCELKAAAFRLSPFESDLDEWMLVMMAHESDLRPQQRNRAGRPYYGLLQLGTHGFPGLTPEQFLALPAAEQLPYVEKFFHPARRHLHARATVAQYSYLPASLARGTSPDTVLARVDGDDYSGLERDVYSANRGFDVDGNGEITVAELDDALERVTTYPRFKEARERLHHASSTCVAWALAGRP